MKTMLAARVHGQRMLSIDTVNRPEAGDGEIRIRVKACSICGSDKRIYNYGDFRAQYPVIIGHEIAGVIDQVGAGVTDLCVGDSVCVAPGYGCGHCRNCIKGQPTVCLNPYPSVGYAISGGFAEYMVVPKYLCTQGFVNKIPEGLPFDEACLAEVIACAVNAHDRIHVALGDHVLILGAGPAGIIHAHLCKLYGATKVTLAQRGSLRLQMAMEKFSDVVDDTICMKEEDVATAYAERNGGRMPDVVIVCAPSKDAQALACNVVAPLGRVNFFAGLPASDCMTTINANLLHYKEFSISGASSSKQIDNVTALELLSKRIIDGKKLISAKFPLKDMGEAFAFAEAKHCLKVVVEP